MLITVAALAAFCVRRIPEGQVYSLRRFGGHTRFVGAGMHFMLPLIERVSHKMSLTGSSIEVTGTLSNGENYQASVCVHALETAPGRKVIDRGPPLLCNQTSQLLARGLRDSLL